MTKRPLLLAALIPAALLACGVSREVDAVAAAATSCTSCHGDGGRGGDPANRAAPPVTPSGRSPGAHLAHLDRRVACASCHLVPTSSGHSDGLVEVRFAGVAVASGAAPSFADGTCSGVYCHGATLRAGGSVPSPAWSGGPLGCGACHGAPPPSHAASSTSCQDCHPGTVKADGTIDLERGLHVNGAVERSGGHPAGWADPALHGPAAKRDLASCQACHGVDFGGGTAGVSCNACHAAAGYAAWSSNCTFCHGTKLATYAPANLGSAAPPRGTAGETATTARAVGAHQAHLAGGATGAAVSCETCHVVPADLRHLDGSAGVTFGPAATRGGTSPLWNGATCASTYCHGGTVAGGTNKEPAWTGGSSQAACGTCHGAPPPAPHTTSTSCGSCHPGYGGAGVNLALHVNGAVDVVAAHPAGWAAKEQHGVQANLTGLAGCKGCHGAALDGAGGTGPSCATCHAPAGYAAWDTTCTFCHGSRTSGRPSPPVDIRGRSDVANTSVGAHDRHVAATLSAPVACSECHPARSASVVTDAAHVDGDGLAEVAFGPLARTGGAAAAYTRASATSATCGSTYCHGTFSGGARATPGWTSTAAMTCTSCHGAPPSTGRHAKHVVSEAIACATCHPYTGTTVTPATHVDGRKTLTATIGWSATSRSCSNGCHGSKSW